MGYTIHDIDKIVNFKTWTDTKKIDELLLIDCRLYMNMGCSSTKQEKEETKRLSRKIYRAIKTIDKKMGQHFLMAMDTNDTK
jgi:hypothetical protein